MASHEYIRSMRIILRFMDLNLMNPLRYSYKIKVFSTLVVFSSIFYICWYLIGFSSNWVDIDSISDGNLIPAGIVAIMKGATFVYYRSNLYNALMLLKDFWKPSRFPKHEEALQKNYHYSYRILVTYFIVAPIMSMPAMFALLFQPGVRELPIKIYPICDLEKSPCYELLYVYLVIYCYHQFIPIHIYFAGFYIAAIAYIYNGIECIKLSLNELDVENSTENDILSSLGEIIDQHNLVLRFLSEIRIAYMVPLLGLFLLTGATEIVGLYMMTADGMPPDMDHIVNYGSILVVFMMELTFFCISASMITEQIESIQDHIYNLNWYSKTCGKIRRTLVFMMVRTQVDESFTIGRMTKLNLETLVMTVRNIFSFYTLLSETSNKEDNA